MKRYLFIALTIVVAILILSFGGVVLANDLSPINLSEGSPTVVSYQGQITEGGVLFDGPGYFKFAIVDSMGAVSYWSNDGTSESGGEPTQGVTLTINGGLFNVLLGDTQIGNMQPLTANVFEGIDRYLRVWFSSDNVSFELLSPDQRIAAVPYALQAEISKNSDLLDGHESNDFQARIQGTCQIGSSIVAVNTDGSVVCDDPNTTYYPFSKPQVIDLSQLDSRLTGFYGGFSDGRYGYLVPGKDPSGTIARIDPLDFSFTGVITLALSQVDTRLFGFQGGFSDGRYGYLVPNNNSGVPSGVVARFDLQNFSESGVAYLDMSGTDSGLKGFSGGFTDGRFGYFVPYKHSSSYSGKLARLDLSDFSATGITVLDLQSVHPQLTGFQGGFTDGEFGYFVPYFNDRGNSGLLARVDLGNFSTAGVSVLDLKNLDTDLSGFIGGFADARYAYFVPYKFGKVVRLNLEDFSTDGVTILDLTTFDVDYTGFLGGFTDGSYAYFIPHNNGSGYVGEVVRIDLLDFTINGVEILNLHAVDPGLVGFAGGFSDGDFGYFIPHYDGSSYSGKLARIPLYIGGGAP